MNNSMILLMVIASFIAGYLSTMNLWANSIGDIRLHLNDFYMVLLMVGWMIVMCYILMKSHMGITKTQLIITITIIIIIVYAIRTQAFIDDKQYLNGMIPHHSMAITMSKWIINRTKDPRIKQLATDIIISQQNEINEMNSILDERKLQNKIF